MDMDFANGCPLVRPRLPHIRLLFVGSRFRSTLPSAGPSRSRPCASLVLPLHQVAQGISPPSLPDMPGTPPIPAKPGRPARYDYEYERNGTANLFMMFAPLEGWRKVKVFGCEASLALSAIRRALMMSSGPASPEGLSWARAGVAVSRSATT